MSIAKLQPTPEIPRKDPDLLAAEWSSLSAWLDFHRATLELKCAGLSEAQLKRRSVPSSSLSLLGLLRHLTEVERGWFAETLAGETTEPLYYSEAEPDGDFDRLDSSPVAEVHAGYRAAVERSREILATFSDADELRRNESERPVNVRWVLMHMVEEYARHNGHADLLREAIDGEVGD